MHFRKILPDELQHQQLVEVRVEQRADDGIELPVVVMCPFSQVDVHAIQSRLSAMPSANPLFRSPCRRTRFPYQGIGQSTSRKSAVALRNTSKPLAKFTQTAPNL